MIFAPVKRDPYAPGTVWDKDKDPPVDTSVPGYILTESHHYVDAHTGKYVAGLPGSQPVPTILPDHRGDGATPAPDHTDVKLTSATDALEHLRVGLGTMLPALLHQASVATSQIRVTVGRGR